MIVSHKSGSEAALQGSQETREAAGVRAGRRAAEPGSPRAGKSRGQRDFGGTLCIGFLISKSFILTSRHREAEIQRQKIKISTQGEGYNVWH